MGPETVYVYGVVPAEDRKPISAPGVQGADVGAVEHEQLAALTSRLPGGTIEAARDVRAHWTVLEEAFERATVLPLRFGTVLESEDSVREHLLEANAERLREMLRALTGRVQLNVKGRYVQEPLLRAIVRDSPEVVALRDYLRKAGDDARTYGRRIHLGELVSAEIARRREQHTRRVLDALEPLAVAHSEEQIAEEHAVFNLAFLIERTDQEAFDRAVGALKQEFASDFELRYIGPLLPYSFADADLAAGSTAWA